VITEPDYVLSPTKASEAISRVVELRTSEKDPSELWRFDGSIWKPDGEDEVTRLIDAACGDLSYDRGLRETLRRIRSNAARVKFNAVPYLLPLQNGTLNIKDGTFREARPDDYLTFKYGAIYDPQADYRPFLWHLCSTLPDPRDVLTAIDIATAAPIRVPFESFVLLFGGGGNGKGIFEKIIQAILSEERTTAITFEEIRKSRFGAGALLDTDLWLVTEVSSPKDAVNILKRVSTGELMDTDIKYGGRKRGKPHVLPILDANNPFDFEDDSKGLRRRFIKLDFPYSYGYGPEDRPKNPKWEDYMLTSEVLAGVVRLIAIRGPSLYQERRIYRRKSEEEIAEEYRRQQYSLHYFCAECLSTKPQGDFEERLTVEKAYSEYQEYCRLFNVPTPSRKVPFGRYIKEMFGIESAVTTNERYYPGLWIVKSAKLAFAENKLNYRCYRSTTDKLQIDEGKIDVHEWITTDATDKSVFVEVLEEIERMYKYIHSCEDPRKISFRSYLANSETKKSVASVASVVKGRCNAISSATDDATDENHL